MPSAYVCTSFGEWESWLEYVICSWTDFTLVFLGKAGFRFSFAMATQSRQVLGACRSAEGGGADFGEWLKPFGMKIYETLAPVHAPAGCHTCSQHLSPAQTQKPDWRQMGLSSKGAQRNRELLIMLVRHYCQLYLALPVLVRGNVLGIFL